MAAAFEQPTMIKQLLVVYDIVGWFKSHIYPMEKHTVPHQFKFEMVGNRVQLSYRLWSFDSGWITPAGQLLDHEVVWLQQPTFKIPAFKKIDLPKIFNNVTNENLKNALDTHKLETWATFYRDLETKKEKYEELSKYVNISSSRLLLGPLKASRNNPKKPSQKILMKIVKIFACDAFSHFAYYMTRIHLTPTVFSYF